MWHEIVAACPDVLRRADTMMLEVVSFHVATHQRMHADGVYDRTSIRLAYRMLGTLFVPMRARRRLLFGDHVRPSRSRRL
jgi:hypothetical protein